MVHGPSVPFVGVVSLSRRARPPPPLLLLLLLFAAVRWPESTAAMLPAVGVRWALLAAVLPASCVVATPLKHGWDCIACDTNSMLAANFGSNRPSSIFNLTDPWWVETVASRYAALAMSNFFDGGNYNGSGTNPMVDVARALKKSNPKMKVLVYVAADRGLLTPFGQHTIQAHPEWWLRT